ncbi:MAG: hypothetical protein WA174_07705 [Rhodoferax sp.]
MALIPWFRKKVEVKPHDGVDSSGLGHTDGALPFHSSAREQAHGAQSSSGANRKSERLQQRELLYAVVRDSMTKAGVLSSNYKFKVLSLDSRGRQYMIMMDLAGSHAGEVSRLAEMEGLIAQYAKARHDIVVTAVYWRLNQQAAAAASAPVRATAPVASDAPAKPGYEPLQADEVAAFKQALASVSTSVPLSAPGEIIRSKRRNPAPQPDFQETQVDDRPLPLSSTQYGDLN